MCCSLGITIARIDCHETASAAPPVQGVPVVLLVWVHGNAGGTDGGGRTLEDLVLPPAPARERGRRRHAPAARDHSAWLGAPGSCCARCHDNQHLRGTSPVGKDIPGALMALHR